MNAQRFIIPGGRKIRLSTYKTDYTGSYASKESAQEKLGKDIAHLIRLQDVLYAQHAYALLVILQGMDAAGKDGAIKHIMSGVNPQGIEVHSFKEPSAEELEHDFFWRTSKALPRRGTIGVFNRSYYEEVLVPRVHPEVLARQRLPAACVHEGIWKRRYEDINAFERYLVGNGIIVLKFYLNISRGEQKKRLIGRIDDPDKQWKFSASDLKTRGYWGRYQKAYEEALSRTSTSWAPWHVVPADHKWFTRLVIADIIVSTLTRLKLDYPRLNAQERSHLAHYKKSLELE